MRKLLLTGDTTVSGIARSLQGQLKRLQPEWLVLESPFNHWLIDVVDPNSLFRTGSPDIGVFVLSPRLLSESPDVEAQLNLFVDALGSHRGNTLVLCTTLAPDPRVPQPLLAAVKLQRAANRANELLFALQERSPWFFLLDQQGLMATHGLKNITDSRYETLARMYYSPHGANLLSEQICRCVGAIYQTPAKVLVLDLDNTLWAGVLGEEGRNGIRMGTDGIGPAFRRFQQALLQLKKNGVLLAICSKNNESDVLDVFSNHPDQLLKLTDFASYRINWMPKPENLTSLAEELNLGLDSFVLFDDSALEREFVRQTLPTVRVIDVPPDPSDYVRALSDFTGFDTFRITDEDRARTRQYRQEAERKRLKEKTASLDEFYRCLEMRAEVFIPDESHLTRLHQLVWKTNQFNLTVRRYDETELRVLLSSSTHLVAMLRLSDKFGESGITGLVIVRKEKLQWEVQNLLLSCRIIGRTAEFAFIRWVARKARKAGAVTLVASFIPSGRNQVASDFLPKAGFVEDIATGKWVLELKDAEQRIPADFLSIQEKAKT